MSSQINNSGTVTTQQQQQQYLAPVAASVSSQNNATYTDNIADILASLGENKKKVISQIYLAYKTYMEPILNMLEQNASKNSQPSVNDINSLSEIINYLNYYSYNFTLFANRVFGKYYIYIYIYIYIKSN